MSDIETFDVHQSNNPNPLYIKQQQDVAEMRASLLHSSENPDAAKQALQHISVLRVYHQVTRIIRYLELMDKLEDKLYRSIDYAVDASDEYDVDTAFRLLAIQERMQKTMIDSQKLLAPYLELVNYADMPITSKQDPINAIMSPEKRENLRQSAQRILQELNV